MLLIWVNKSEHSKKAKKKSLFFHKAWKSLEILLKKNCKNCNVFLSNTQCLHITTVDLSSWLFFSIIRNWGWNEHWIMYHLFAGGGRLYSLEKLITIYSGVLLLVFQINGSGFLALLLGQNVCVLLLLPVQQKRDFFFFFFFNQNQAKQFCQKKPLK